MEDYLSNPFLYTKKISFSDHGKARDIVTYSSDNGSILRKKHNEILSQLESLPSSNISYAYKKGVRVLEAIKPHLGNITFLKLDIKGYFEHIDTKLLKSKIKQYGINIELEYCLYDDKVPIGFITSPKLSDFYLYELDKAAEQYIDDHPGLKYSRYADDFLISSPSQDFDDVLNFGQFIKNELNKHHLELNEEKTTKAKLGKQTSVRFLGLNIGKDKITLSKWYILKTITAFKRYYFAKYCKQENVNLLKSIAYGLYNFIEQNSEYAKQRFLKKYKNVFKKTFTKELQKEINDGLITYQLADNSETYTAVINRSEYKEQPEEICFRDKIDGVFVTTVINNSYDNRLQKVGNIKLPKHVKRVSLPHYKLNSLKKNPISDLVDLKTLRTKGNIDNYSNIKEIGTLSPHYDAWDYDESIYAIKKVEGGYSAEKIHNGFWSVAGSPRYIKNASRFISSSPLADQLFYYLAEQVINNKFKCSYGRELYAIEGNRILSSPVISIKHIAALQYFFDEVIKVDTKNIRRLCKTVEDNNAKEFKQDKNSSNCFKADLPFDKENQSRISLCLDFDLNEDKYVSSHTLLDKSQKETVYFEKSTFEFLNEERIKELLLSCLMDFDEKGDESLFVFTYQNKKYYAKQIKTSLYHLLQYISPIEFKIADNYLVNDGVGEYLFAGCGDKEIPSNAYQGIESLKVVRISDELSGRESISNKIGIGDYAFKDCKNLKKVYISSAFYSYRNEDRLIFGKGVFDGCDKLNGSIILFPSEDHDYVCITEEGRVKRVEPINIEITTLDELIKLDQLGEHATIEVSCSLSIKQPVMEAIKSHKNIVSWTLRSK